MITQNSNPLRILVFYQYYGTPKGGWSTRFYEFTRRWVAEGHQVTVVTSPYYKSDIRAKGFVTRTNIEGVDLIIINTPDSNKVGLLKRAFNAITFAFSSIYYALTLPCDVVLASSGPITIGIPALFAKIFRAKKMVFEVRDLWPRGGIELGKLSNPTLIRIALWFEKFCYQNASLVVACSVGMEEGVRQVHPLAKTLVIPNSSDVELFSQLTGYPNDFNESWKDLPIFVYIGSLGLMDDCSQILKGLRLVKHHDFRMVFLGDGEEKPKLEKSVIEFGLSERISFLGLVDKHEVAKWLNVARASFLTFKDFPVLQTNSPNKLFDSFAAGVPVIQSTRGWICQMIKSENAGWNVDPLLPETFATAVEEVIVVPEIAIEKGLNALRLAEGPFNRTYLSNRYLEEIERIINA